MKEYKRFYHICDHLLHLAPWDFLGSKDYSQMFLDIVSNPVLVKVVGDVIDQHFGFIICMKAIQSNYLLSFEENIKEHILSGRRRYQYYLVSYKKYLDMNKEEKVLIDKFTKVNEEFHYPLIQHFQWNKESHSYNEKELSDINFVLENLFILLNCVALGKITKKKDIREVPTRVYNPKTKLYDNFYLPFVKEMFCITPTFKVNDKFNTDFLNLNFNSMTVEYDLLFLPLKANDSLLAVYVLYDLKGDKVLEMNFVNLSEDRILSFLNIYLGLVKKFGYFHEVRCRDSLDKILLESLAISNKPEFVIKELKNIDNLVEDLVMKYK
jgi:hypothetical protein